MYIFIDESGAFALEPGGHSVSVVGALIIPEHKFDQLLRKYRKLRLSLRKDKGEVKGRLLAEPEVARVLELLRKNSCIFEAVAIDLGAEPKHAVEAHLAKQAEALTEHLTPRHQPGMIAGVWDLRRRLEEMPLPLYVQSVATMELLGNIIHRVPAYWALRVPKEILSFHWVIDGKGVGKVTAAEDWWSTTMLGLLQSRSHRQPMIAPDWVDYSAFNAKFERQTPHWLKEHMPGMERGIDLRLLMKETFRFSSTAEPGLELVDVVTNATRRALMGNLGRSGWAGVPRLMIHRSEQYLELIALSDREEREELPYGRVLAVDFRTGGRNLLTPSC